MARLPIALQLHSIRDDCQKDLAKSLAAVAEMGYEGVELARTFDYSAADWRRLLDDCGLQVAGAHVGLSKFAPDSFAQTIEFYQTIGSKYLIVPWLPAEKFNTADACKTTAQELNALAEQLKGYGMRIGFHNHYPEVQPLPAGAGGPLTAFEAIFNHTTPDVIVQVDVGHAKRGGADPVELIKKYPGRVTTVHLKEFSPTDDTAVIGAGIVPWPDVFSACETVGGTEWYIVEHEFYSDPPLVCVRQCLEALQKMGK